MDALSWFDAGYTAQVSIVPPNAEVQENSTINPADAGKVPGLKGRNGKYHGYDWLNTVPFRENVMMWKQNGSSVGFLAGHYPAIDIDIMREDISAEVVKEIEDQFGPCLIRTGQIPKRLLIFRCDEPLRSFDMHYSQYNDLLGCEDRQLIQFLGKGRQYVMDGIHPRTGKSYTITDPNHAMILGPSALPTLTPDIVIEVFKSITEVMARFGYKTTSSPEARLLGGDVDQEGLKAPNMGDLLELVSRLPNEVPDREEYVLMGYAIKAAGQEDTELAFEAFLSWCERWNGGHNDVDTVRRDWDKMVPPYRAGYDWLMSKAQAWRVDISDLQFGQAEPGPTATSGAPPPAVPDADIQASLEARQRAAAEDSAMLSDDWIATKFVQKLGHDYLLPEGLPKDCLKWDGKQWLKARHGVIYMSILAFMRSHVPVARELFTGNADRAAAATMRLGSAKTLESVFGLVKRYPSMTVEMSELDKDPNLLNTPSGPVHLPSGQYIDAERGMYLTKATSVSMDLTGHCPLWTQFIQESTNSDASLAFYLQCLAGYALTGHTSEQVFPFFVGAGGNGKSVFIKVLSRLLGSYATSAPVELFQLGRQSNDTPYQLAMIQGARLVTTSETKAGGMWDEQRIKQITGEDVIAARLPYGVPFTYEAQCTLIVVGNYNPDLEAITDAMSRRIKVIPWDNKPADPDKWLVDKLLPELPGILAWCVQGAMAWYEHGLPECEIVARETAAYVADQDTLGQWLESVIRVTGNPGDFIPGRDFYQNYVTWCRVNGLDIMSQRKFTQRLVTPLRAKGVARKRTGSSRGWEGAMLLSVEDAPSNVMNFPAIAEPPRNR